MAEDGPAFGRKKYILLNANVGLGVTLAKKGRYSHGLKKMQKATLLLNTNMDTRFLQGQ